MAKKAKVRKQCPACGAFVFQGPYKRGEIHDGKMVVQEKVYSCVTCHAVSPMEDDEFGGVKGLVDVPVPDYGHVQVDSEE